MATGAITAPTTFVPDEVPAAPGEAPPTDKTLFSQLYPEMHRVAAEWGVTPEQAGERYTQSQADSVNKAVFGLVRKEAERRVASRTPGRIARGVQQAGVDLGHSLTDPVTLGIGATVMAVPALATTAPLVSQALAATATGVTAGLAAKATGNAVGGISVEGTPLDQMIREALGATVMVAATHGVAKGAGGTIFEPTVKGGKTATPIASPPEPPPAPSATPTDLLPDMLPRAESKAGFSQRFGAGNLPFIGRLFYPAAKPLTPVGEALQGYFGERYGTGPAMSSRFGSLIKGLDDPWEVNATGDITNIVAREGQSRKISDVLEALQRDPDAYELTSAQRASVERIAEVERHFNELESRYDISRQADNETTAPDDLVTDTADAPTDTAYFPRVVTARPTPPPITTGGQPVGARQFFEKPRMFETEAEGWGRGFRYETSMERRLVTRADRLYKKIADKRLVEDPALDSRSRQELDAQLATEYATDLADGTMTPDKLGKIADSIQRRGTVHQPGFAQRIFSPETADVLNKALATHTSSVRQAFVKVNNAAKTLFLGFDLGNLFIQMLPTLYKNPGKWAEGAWRSLKALGSEKAFAAYVRDNAEVVRELAEHGSATGRLPEFLAGFEQGEIIPKIPVIGPAAEAFGRQFRTALDVAKVELWKAYRDVTPPEGRMDAIRGIEAQLLSGRMESAGVTPNRALTERAFFLAPAYYRGAFDLLGNVASRGVSGQIARRAIGAYMTVGPALYLGVGSTLVSRGDMTEDELRDRLNPSAPEFLMWKVNVAGKPVNVGFGGIYKSLLKLGAGMVKTSYEHPENWASLDPQENPLVRWLRAHSAPVPSLAFDQFTGRDFLGRDVNAGDIAPRLLPLAVQSILSKEGEPPPSPAEAAFSLLGLSAYTEPVQRRFDAERQRRAHDRHGKAYEALSINEQALIVRELQKDPAFKRPPASALQTDRAIRAAGDRARRLMGTLNDKNRAVLNELGLQVRGYTPSLTVNGVRLPLTRVQVERYETAIAAEYDAALTKHAAKLRSLPVEQRQEFLDQVLQGAREKAKAVLVKGAE